MRLKVCLSALLLMVQTAWAGDVLVAVAANFAGPMEKIAVAFEQATGHKASVATGATGKFYAQIKNGAPFEVLLAADSETPKKLQDEGLGVPGSAFTYAQGSLVLWSATPGFVDSEGAVLKQGGFKHLAICNPKLAPYGQAAVETLKALNLYGSLSPKFVLAENVAQAHQFTASGNAELGFVALSQIAPPGKTIEGSYWLVPSNLYAPILQDTILLKKGEGNPAALALMKFLKSEAAKAIILSYGYRL
ncbi:MAG: molybdate ABC transporter substrate-binding protein [Betaproteobacteria bacterium]|nr:molybdate ABC transporter substrate-binding protein [Betaproteobacteria bacterium]